LSEFFAYEVADCSVDFNSQRGEYEYEALDMTKKNVGLAIAVLLLFSIAGLTACGSGEDREINEVLKQFDLTDTKTIWAQIDGADFTDDVVIVVLRKTSTYPELELKYFKLDNAKGIEYADWRPPAYFFTPGYEDFLDGFRASVHITLKDTGKDKVVEAIRHLETLDFVMYAGPNSIGSGTE